MGFGLALLFSFPLVVAADPPPDIPATAPWGNVRRQIQSEQDHRIGRSLPAQETEAMDVEKMLGGEAAESARARSLEDRDVGALTKAANQGDADAQYWLGFAYYAGKDVRQDVAEAARWWGKAADQGHARAQSNLGVVYYHGTGVRQDFAEAVRWYKKAADQGDAGAQNSLGVAYFTGKGAPQNYVEAYFWGNLAAALGKGGAENAVASARDQAAAKLSPSELSATQKRCRQWVEAFERRRAQKR